jgi:hypothetical protein
MKLEYCGASVTEEDRATYGTMMEEAKRRADEEFVRYLSRKYDLNCRYVQVGPDDRILTDGPPVGAKKASVPTPKDVPFTVASAANFIRSAADNHAHDPCGCGEREYRDMYRAAARKLHPDTGGTTAQFQRLQEARAIVERCREQRPSPRGDRVSENPFKGFAEAPGPDAFVRQHEERVREVKRRFREDLKRAGWIDENQY